MTEPLWIYTTSPKLKISQDVIQMYPYASVTEHESQIVLQSKINTVIIISQLSQEAQLKLNIDNSYFYVGVRTYFESFKVFENVYEVNQQLNERRSVFLHRIQQNYIKQLNPVSIKDRAYLQQLIEHFDELYEDMESIEHEVSKYKLSLKLKSNLKFRSKQYENFKGIIAVYDCPQAAIALAESLRVKSLLLMDGNLLRPTLDDYLRISKIETNVESHLTGIDNTGINIVLDSLRKHTKIKHDLKHIIKRHHHYDVLLGNYNILNYEHYDTGALNTLVETMANLYGCLIISLGDNLYDYMTLMCLNKSDVNIICLEDTKNSVLWTKQMLEVLRTKQFIEPSKQYVYKLRESLKPRTYSESVMSAIFKDQYKGTINLKQNSTFKKLIKELVK